MVQVQKYKDIRARESLKWTEGIKSTAFVFVCVVNLCFMFLWYIHFIFFPEQSNILLLLDALGNYIIILIGLSSTRSQLT